MERFDWQEMAAVDTKTASSEGTTLKVEISGITPEQAQKFKDLFAWMNVCGGVGASRSAKIFYDGDGGARARISVDGEEVKPAEGADVTEEDEASFGFE